MAATATLCTSCLTLLGLTPTETTTSASVPPSQTDTDK